MSETPEEGDIVCVEYDVYAPTQGIMDGHTDLTMEVVEHNDGELILGPEGIGTRVTASGRVFGPTSSDGFHADGDRRIQVGKNAEWEIVERA